jgi:S-methylmethionine-dependent homocysteine/selenocysteine methylase
MSARYREGLPQLGGELFFTDGGIETTLVFHREIDLPEFAAFDLLSRPEGVDELRRYFQPYLDVAAGHGAGFVLESPTWRANPVWAEQIGYDPASLDRLNREGIALLEELRASVEADADRAIGPVVISGCIGPHDDGYDPVHLLDADQATDYHSTQIGTFAETAADMVSAITMTYLEEAVGVARAATAAGMPVAISYTLETDGRLPSGQDLGEAIEAADADPDSEIAYFMLNCAHPTHFEETIESAGPWRERVRGLRANASRRSHAELDEATELDEGDPEDLARRYVGLRERLPAVNVLGGCCGTDDRHIAAIGAAWTSSAVGAGE